MEDTRDMVALLALDSRACRATARRLRDNAFYCRIAPAQAGPEHDVLRCASGIVLCGGSAGEPEDIPQLEGLLSMGVPLLALGDAALTLCLALGGRLGEKAPEPGVQQVTFHQEDPLTGCLESSERWLQAFRPMLPGGSAAAVAASADGVLGIRRAGEPVYGFTFQVEANDPDGMALLRRFCGELCGCTDWWSTQAFIRRAEEEIAKTAGDGDAVCAVSGGVDSAVCAMLGHMALGHRLHCVLVDTGLLREGEADRSEKRLLSAGLQVRRVDASREMIEALKGLTDPVEKGKTVFARMRAILRREVAAWPDTRVILQGTNYSDSLSAEPPFPVEIQGARVRIVEPVRDLFKDEIRRVAEELRLPETISARQAFPGGGLAVRMQGEVTAEKLAYLRAADAIFREEVERAGLQKRLRQYFTLLMDAPEGEGGYIAVLRAVQTASAITAARLPMDLLEVVTERITAEVPAIRRIMYELTKG